MYDTMGTAKKKEEEKKTDEKNICFAFDFFNEYKYDCL